MALESAADCLSFPMLIGGFGWWGLRHAVRIHAGGIEVDGFVVRTRIRFDEADTLVYRSVAQNVNGIPVGTYVWARLRGGKRAATFNLRVENANADALEDFRIRASEAILARAWERMAEGEPFRWGKAQQMDLALLRYRASGLVGRKPEVAIPYAGLRYSFDAGSFSVHPPDSDGKLFTMKCDEPNFYRGFLLFQHLTAPR